MEYSSTAYIIILLFAIAIYVQQLTFYDIILTSHFGAYNSFSIVIDLVGTVICDLCDMTFFKHVLMKLSLNTFFLKSTNALQSWPKVLRMTQILISTKFAASVSLDIFVRCYYGILEYNYKHFISVKGFYRQLHEVDAKSQYLQC